MVNVDMMEKIGVAACTWLAQWGAARWYGRSGQVRVPLLGGVSYGVGSGMVMALGSIAGQFVEDFVGDALSVDSAPVNFLIGAGVGAGVSAVTGTAVAPGVVQQGGGAMMFGGQAVVANFLGSALYMNVKKPLLNL